MVTNKTFTEGLSDRAIGFSVSFLTAHDKDNNSK